VPPSQQHRRLNTNSPRCAQLSTRPSPSGRNPPDAAKKIVSDNSVFNKAVTTLLDEQVRKIALLDGAAYRQASYAISPGRYATSAASTPACTRIHRRQPVATEARRWRSAARRGETIRF